MVSQNMTIEKRWPVVCAACKARRLGMARWAGWRDLMMIFPVGSEMLRMISRKGYVRSVRSGAKKDRNMYYCVEDVDSALKALAEGRLPEIKNKEAE